MDGCFGRLAEVSDALVAGMEASVAPAERGEAEVAQLAALCVALRGRIERGFTEYAEQMAKMNRLLRDCVENDALRRWVGVGPAGILESRR